MTEINADVFEKVIKLKTIYIKEMNKNLKFLVSLYQYMDKRNEINITEPNEFLLPKNDVNLERPVPDGEDKNTMYSLP
ncbi:MAG: hypothetical protein PHS54_02655 [Clostridia bacterium]|nr:hypothetical protein [Clostridia bacterium]